MQNRASELDNEYANLNNGIIKRILHLFRNRRVPETVVLIAALLSLPSLWNGFNLDDNFNYISFTQSDLLPSLVGSPKRIFTLIDDTNRQSWMNYGLLPWWTPEDAKISFFRPISSGLHAMDYSMWSDYPVIMHLHSLFWFSLLVFFASLLYRRISGSFAAAALASLLFAVNDTHGFSVGWLANRHALVTAFFGVLTLLTFDQWKKRGQFPQYIMSIVFFIFALFSGEGAIAITAYLFAYVLFIEKDLWKKRILELLPFALVVVEWRIIYSALGYGIRSSNAYIDPLGEPLVFVQKLVERVPIYLFGELGFPPSEVHFYLPSTAAIWMSFGAILFIGLLGLISYPVLKKDAGARFWVTAFALSAFPISASIPDSRNGIFVSLGVMGFLGQLFIYYTDSRSLKDFNITDKKYFRIPAKILLAFLFVVHLVIAPVLLTVKSAAPSIIQKMLFAETNSSFPDNQNIKDKEYIVVNAPAYLPNISFFVAYRGAREQQLPKKMVGLATGDIPVLVRRIDDRSLLLEMKEGFLSNKLDRNLRGVELNLFVGQKIVLDSMTAEIKGLTADGRPGSVLFRFNRSLDDPSFAWVTWKNGMYVPFELPKINEEKKISLEEASAHDDLLEREISVKFQNSLRNSGG